MKLDILSLLRLCGAILLGGILLNYAQRELYLCLLPSVLIVLKHCIQNTFKLALLMGIKSPSKGI
jgi:hypothetical protein